VNEQTRLAAQWIHVDPPVELAPEEAHVWRVATQLPREQIARLWSLLDADEEKRALALVRGAVRDGFVVTRSALRLVLATYLGRSADELGFRYGRRGKPYLEGAGTRALRFSVTHSGTVSLIAVARNRELGIDVEPERWPRSALRIARRLFHPDTAAGLEALDGAEQRRAFLAAWTQHEAYMKAIGEGLFRSADPLRLVWPRGEATELVEEHAMGGATRMWSITPLEPVPTYTGTLVTEGAIRRVRRLDATALVTRRADPRAGPAR
jgi:4'-phosphopantetheinyl transferase